MAGGNPIFGDTNEVTVLDIGQPGGTRAAAGTALLSGRIERGGETVAETQQQFPQQSIVIQDNLGFTGVLHRLLGVMRANNLANFHVLQRELDQRRTGQLRDATTGVLGAFDPLMIRETQLTDFDGSVIATEAVLAGWRLTGRVQQGDGWILAPIEIIFRVLA